MSGIAGLREPQDAPAFRAGVMLVGSARRGDERRATTRAALVVGDALSLLAIVGSIPFVVLAIGIPVALALQLVLWIGRLL